MAGSSGVKAAGSLPVAVESPAPTELPPAGDNATLHRDLMPQPVASTSTRCHLLNAILLELRNRIYEVVFSLTLSIDRIELKYAIPISKALVITLLLNL